jgi:hypothetical protein
VILAALLSVVALSVGALSAGWSAAPARADERGLLRVAHLSPDTPAADVSIEPLGGEESGAPVTGVRYGTVSGWQRLAPGRYAVALRASGAPASTPPALSTAVDVTPGSVQTVAAVGRFADLRLQLLDEDLSSPASGRARVRVVDAASAGPLDVVLTGGPALAGRLAFPGVSGWSEVAGGAATARLSAGGGAPVEVPLRLPAGSVTTLLVLDAPGGGLTLRPVVDAGGPSVPPSGAVPAGGGGTAGSPPPGGPLRPVAAGLCVAAIVALLLTARLRRRGP